MRTLVIDTATRVCSVALFDGDQCIAGHHEIIGRGHAERLLPYIAALPELGRADQIAVNVGPGSFTGIRVGISAARALAFAWDAPCHGYNCLDLVAAMACQNNAVDVIMTGGHGEYFFQQFGSDGLALSEPCSLPIEEAAKKSVAPNITGDASALLRGLTENKILHDHLPDARQWFRIAAHDPVEARPFYGRAPDAKLPNAKVQMAKGIGGPFI
jgi:tRNA threonylcarbamoyladenosine biosynthesis protein TsaB